MYRNSINLVPFRLPHKSAHLLFSFSCKKQQYSAYTSVQRWGSSPRSDIETETDAIYTARFRIYCSILIVPPRAKNQPQNFWNFSHSFDTLFQNSDRRFSVRSVLFLFFFLCCFCWCLFIFEKKNVCSPLVRIVEVTLKCRYEISISGEFKISDGGLKQISAVSRICNSKFYCLRLCWGRFFEIRPILVIIIIRRAGFLAVYITIDIEF